MVYGELGQYPLFVNSTLKVLKVLVVCFKDGWHQQAYKIMILMDESEKKCWVTEVKHWKMFSWKSKTNMFQLAKFIFGVIKRCDFIDFKLLS